MIYTTPLRLLLIAAILSAATIAWAQVRTSPNDGGGRLVIKVYQVTDLLTPARNYPFDATFLPGAAASRGTTGGGGGSSSGGMGGMGTGGGMFQVRDDLAQAPRGNPAGARGGGAVAASAQNTSAQAGALPRIEMNDLIDSITSLVEAPSWERNGGAGAIQPIGGALAIRQTPEVHAKVKEFLDALRQEGSSNRTLTIRARWLLLNDQQRDALTVSANAAQREGPTPVIREVLRQLPVETQQFSGQITCFSGQTVHIISGNVKSVVQSYIPVVGGDIGYQPVVLVLHLGVLMQVTPSILPGDKGVFLDLHSSVTTWDSSTAPDRLPAPIQGGDRSNVSQYPAPMDPVRLAAQQFATSVRVTLDQPAIVGGMTFPASDAGQAKGQLYLLVDISAN